VAQRNRPYLFEEPRLPHASVPLDEYELGVAGKSFLQAVIEEVKLRLAANKGENRSRESRQTFITGQVRHCTHRQFTLSRPKHLDGRAGNTALDQDLAFRSFVSGKALILADDTPLVVRLSTFATFSAMPTFL
jgi:hypothetical protein